MRFIIRCLLISSAISPVAAAWPQRVPAIPGVRPLGREDRESAAGAFSAINGVRVVRSGAIFVNDRARRRVVMLDQNLRLVKVVLDAAPATGAYYGGLGAHLIAMPGDSTMFVDAASRTLTVFDAQGKVVRRSDVPPRADLGQLILGNPAFDSEGRLVYRARGRSQFEIIRLSESGQPARAESVPILRLDLRTGRLDTATFVTIYQQGQVPHYVGSGMDLGTRVEIRPVLHPAPTVDEWSVTADGRIVVVRGEDYHADYIDSTGSSRRGKVIPSVAEPLDRAAKVALLDSSRAVRARMLAAGLPLGYDVAPLPGAVFYSAPGIHLMTTPDAATPAIAGGDTSADTVAWVSPDELPDRLPAFPAGGVRADADGNVWVQRLSIAPARGGLIYDIIGSSGQLVDRVQVPPGDAIVGFVPGGMVLLARRDASGLRLVRAGFAHPAPTP